MQGGEVFDEDSFEIGFLKIREIEIPKNEFFGLFQDLQIDNSSWLNNIIWQF